MNLQEMLEAYVLGHLSKDELPTIGSRAIEEGYDSPTLYDLAASEGQETGRITKLFSKTLEELRLDLPTEKRAAISWAKRIATKVVEYRLSPYSGARQIWTEIYCRFPHIDELRIF